MPDTRVRRGATFLRKEPRGPYGWKNYDIACAACEPEQGDRCWTPVYGRGCDRCGEYC